MIKSLLFLLLAAPVSAQCCYYPVVPIVQVQPIQVQPIQVQPIQVQPMVVQQAFPVDVYRPTLGTRLRWAAEDRARRRAPIYSVPAFPAFIGTPVVQPKN